MRAPNLRFPHLRAPHVGRLHFSMPHGMGDMHFKTSHMRALGNIWTLLLAAIVVTAVLVGLWMAGIT